MYTPGQVSKMLDIPASTLRRYAQVFHEHLSEYANKRHRQYTDQDVDTLARVRSMIADGLSHDEIKQQLPIMEEANAIDNSLALVPTIAQRFEMIELIARNTQMTVDELKERLLQNESEWDSSIQEISQRFELLVNQETQSRARVIDENQEKFESLTAQFKEERQSRNQSETILLQERERQIKQITRLQQWIIFLSVGFVFIVLWMIFQMLVG